MLLPKSYFEYHEHADARQRAKGFLVTIAIVWPFSMFFLWYIWYMGNHQTEFHFFNDLGEWMLMDKIGHFLTNFQNAVMPTVIFCWTGLDPKKSAFYGFLFSFILMGPVEIFDGFSTEWGFSWADMAANVLGAVVAYVQLRSWGEIRILPQFSFHQTIYALARPDMFGSNYVQNSIKDYNGQTLWLTFDVNKLLGKKIFPAWLLLSIGYGAEGMYGGFDNVWTDKNGVVHDYSHVERFTKFFLSVDIDLDLVVKNRVLKRWLYPVNIFKLPMPTIEFSEKGVQFHILYY